MTLNTFNALTELERIRAVLRSDALIGHRCAGACSMHLYAVADFYVEVVYTTRRKQVKEVAAFKEDERLEPYLDQIDLSELWW